MSLNEEASYEMNECTQGVGDSQFATQQSASGTDECSEENALNIWGTLKYYRNRTVYNLVHRNIGGVRDSYTIGRDDTNDIVVKDKHVSKVHCRIYCDYEEARIRVFILQNTH